MNPPKIPKRPQAARAPAPHDRAGKMRDDRLKAALKANLARRKAQARARSEAESHDTIPQGAPDND